MRKAKTIVCTCLTLILLFSVSFAVKAVNSEPIYTNSSKVFDIGEYKEVVKAVADAELLSETQANRITTSDAIAEDAGYKLFSLLSPDFLNSLRTEASIASLLSEEYVWVVSAQNKIVKVNDKDGKWSVIGYTESGSTLSSASVSSGMVNLSSVNTLLSARANDGEDVNGVVACFDAPMYHTSFVLCDVDDAEYLIPYGTRPDLTGLENGTYYSRQQVLDILSENFGVSYSGNSNAGGGSSQRQTQAILLISLGIATAMLCMSFLLLFLKKRKS